MRVRISRFIPVYRIQCFTVSLVKLLGASFLLVGLALVWALLFLLLLPFLILDLVFGWSRKETSRVRRLEQISQGSAPVTDSRVRNGGALPYDRTSDVSKLMGSNTRGVPYRWSIFLETLNHVSSRSSSIRALDFGAGSLRDTFELAMLGWRVTSVDLDRATLEQYRQEYDWSPVLHLPVLACGSVEDVKGDEFDVVTAFDVLEHLESPGDTLCSLGTRLAANGVILVTVPNGRNLFERYFHLDVMKRRRRGETLTGGAIHLQCRSPESWSRLFRAHGFHIIAQDMALGMLVNDVFHGTFGIAVRYGVAPAVVDFARRVSMRFDANRLEKAFYPGWLMRRVNVLDEWLKPILKRQFGWCLFVLGKDQGAIEQSTTPVQTERAYTV